jgi:polysaccharide biosynthesis protein PslH
MKIAYLVPYVPNRIRTRPYNLILQLLSLGHWVEVFTLGSNEQDLKDVKDLRSKGVIVHYQHLPVWRSLLNSALAIPTGQPLQSFYSWHKGLARQIGDRVSRKEYDVVQVEHLRGSRYGLFVKEKFRTQSVVWDSVDCISHLFEQASRQSGSLFGKFVTRFELPRTKRAEGNFIHRFDHTLVTSATDRTALLELDSAKKASSPLSVLPNGVDLNYFYINPEVQRKTETVVFSGKMSYHANISMVKYLVSEIMPRVWKVRPGAELLIVGKDPPAEIRALGKMPRITVTGMVDDIRPFLWQATTSVVPLLYGAGIQNKVLEAMATATPVITTSRTLSALEAEAGSEIVVADSSESFAIEILKIMSNLEHRNKIGNAGLAYVQRYHDWKNIAGRLVDVYLQGSNQ